MSHALVIGGTGMLRSAVLTLAAGFDVVSVIARSESRLARLVEEGGKEGRMIHPLALDYRNDEELILHLNGAIARFGEISLVLAWIHSVAPNAGPTIARLLNARELPCRWFDVLGSAVADPSSGGFDKREGFAQWNHLHYRAVILGFVVEESRSRWLSDEEISAGTIDAIRQDVRSSIVGQVRPWSARP